MILKVKIPLLYDYVFPSYVIPNCMKMDFVLINYIHSQHSNASNGNDLFASNQNTDLFEKIFGDSLGHGHWPACWNCDSQLKTGSLEDYIELDSTSLFYGKKQYNKYFYSVSITPHIDDFIGDTYTGGKLNGEYFWKHMSQEALIDAKKGRAFIILDYLQENEVTKKDYENLHIGLRKSGIPASQVILLFNTFNGADVYKEWFSEEERMLNVINFPYLILNSSFHYSVNQHIKKITPIKFLSLKNKLRPNHFLFKIRRPRDHRQVLLAQLYNDGYLNKGNWSCLQKLNHDIEHLNSLQNNFGFNNIEPEKIMELHNKLPKTLNNEINEDFNSLGGWADVPDNYLSSYFYIATETYMNLSNKSLTEKIFKPIAHFMPFVFVSWPGSLKLLRELGFKTFHPFIDESYDNETNNSIRLHKIYKEIKRLCDMPIQDLHNWYWSMEKILIHNHYHLINYYKNNEYSKNLAKILNDKLYS